MDLDPRSRDLVIRTILGEAAQEPDEGQAAVAAVILNRLNSGKWGKSAPEVVLAKHQFEPWSTQQGRSRMFGYSPDSQPYQRASAALDTAISGNDPTNGATHFFSPSAQQALGRQPPSWAFGDGQSIGRHTFYAPEGRARMAQAQNSAAGGLPPGFQLMDDAAAPGAQPASGLPPGFQLMDDIQPQATGNEVAGAQPQRSAVEAALSPITSYPETYNRMRKEGADQLSRGVEQITGGQPHFDPVRDAEPPDSATMRIAKGAGNVALGGIGYVASPINAAIRSFVGQPVQDATGIPAEYTDFATSLAIPGIGMSRLGSVPAAAPALKPGQKIVQAGENLGNVGAGGPVQIPRSIASDSMSTQRTAAAVGNIPIAGNPIVRSAAAVTEKLGQKAADIAGEYGSASVQTAGETAGTAIKDWIKGDQSKKFYDRVDALVNPSVTTDLVTTRGVAQNVLSRRANAAIAEKSQAVARIEDAVTRPGGLNYEGVKDLRTYIGELLDKPHLLPADISGKELKQIYGSLSQDLKTAVRNAGGPQAEAAFSRANTHARLVSERRESLAKVVGADGNAPAEQVFDKLVTMASTSSRADISKLAQARKVMKPDEWNEVASAAISRMGSNEVNGQIVFSPQKFLTAYNDKLSKPGREILFRSAGKESIAPYLDDIATISTRFRELQKFANPSGTGQTVAGAAGLAGIWVEPVTAISSAVGAHVIARVLSNPATVAPAAQWTRKYTLAVQAPTPANVAQLTIASRNLANTVNSNLGTSVQWQDFLRGLQGPIPSRADKENDQP